MFDFINKMTSGYKTQLGMVAATVAFLGVILNLILDGVQIADWQPFITALSAWLLAVGLGHKAQKIEGFLKK